MSTDQSPDTEERPEAQRRRRQASVISVAAAVLLAGGGAAYWASTASGGGGPASPGEDGAPPRLTLDRASLSMGSGGGSERGSIAPGEPMGPSSFRADGKLPKGPGKAPVHHLNRAVEKSDVAKLGDALGVDGTPKKKDGRWEIRSGTGPLSATLRVDVRDSHAEWVLLRGFAASGKCANPAPGSGHLRSGGDAAARGSVCLPAGQGKGDAVSAKEAKKAVRPALPVLGLKDTTLDVRPASGPTRTVQVTPRVDGLPATGWNSTFLVDKNGKVSHAGGIWGGATKGDTYPVMSADKALDQLNKDRQKHGGTAPAPGACATPESGERGKSDKSDKDSKDAAPGCPSPGGDRDANEPAEVKGATFGLAPRYSHGKPVLVPSWTFKVAMPGGDGTYPVSYPAVEPKFLTETKAGQGSDAGSGSSPGSDRSSAKPGGGSVGVGEPGGGGKAERPLRSYEADGRTLKVKFWGGVCDKYKATADESGSTVKVAVKAEKQDSKENCVMIAKKRTVEVKLDKALGDRKVVDARDGDKLPRS